MQILICSRINFFLVYAIATLFYISDNKVNEQNLYEQELLNKQKMMTSLLTEVMAQKKMVSLTLLVSL